jgi:hypothetical protein
VTITRVSAPADCFAVWDKRFLECYLDAEAPEQTFHDHLKVDLALARNDRLVNFVIDAIVKRRVFLVQRGQTHREFVFITLRAQP